jgi:glycerate 2-kinase
MAINGIPERVLVAPDSFKGTLSSREVAAALARGLAGAGRSCDLCPVADGGEGTLDALAPGLGAELLLAPASDPLGRPIEAPFALAGPGRRAPARAIVECSAASGLTLVAERERDPVAASSYGTGQLIAAALAAGAELVYVGAGGSATTDGGAGAISAIREAGGLRGARLAVLCDVRTAFEDAARVFAPQKGANAEQVRQLTARLGRLARGFARDPRGRPLTGAAGGLAGGLWAELGAELVPGAQFTLDAIAFDARMRAARAVVTGEGRLDRQSLAGKLLAEVATRARQSGVPAHAVVGQLAVGSFELRVLDLQLVLEAGTPAELERAGAALAEVL